MTLLSTIQNACNELGIPAPATVEDATDKRAVTLKALARREQLELARRYDWPALRFEYEFTTEEGVSTYGLPDDVDKILVDTVYDQSSFRQVRGAMTPAEWRSNVVNGNSLCGLGFRTIRQAEILSAEMLPNTSLLAADGRITLSHWVLTGDGTAISDMNPANKLSWDLIVGVTVVIGGTYRFTADDVNTTHATLILNVAGSGDQLCNTVDGNFSLDFVPVALTDGSVYIIDEGDTPAIRIANPSLRQVSVVKRGIVIAQTPTVADNMILEYKTNLTAFAAAGTAKELMTLNGDTTRLDENLIELGIKWRWLKSRGLDYGEEYRSYYEAVDTRYAQDLTLPSVPLAPRRITHDLGPMTDGYVPDRGYGP